MTKPVLILRHKVGETVSFDVIPDEETTNFDGTEVVRCDLKRTSSSTPIPDIAEPVLLSLPSNYNPQSEDAPSSYAFTISPDQSASLGEGEYIVDAVIEFTPQDVVILDPILIQLCRTITHD